MKPRICAIVGPTATGKSEIALEVAETLNAEIVSIDSMQVYRDMDIGTAKLKEEDRYSENGIYIKHHLLDIVSPFTDFSAADFQERAKKAIKNILGRRKTPLLVGGTGLYYEAVTGNYKFSNQEFDPDLRKELKNELATYGEAAMHDKLSAIDSAAAHKIHPNDVKRVIRALEFYYLTGKQFSKGNSMVSKPYETIGVGLYMEREKLYESINKRVDKMIASGLVEEVKYIIEKGCSPSSNSMQGLGYKQIIGYLQGDYDFETCVENIKRDTRRFAKRQLTWFRRYKDIVWYNVNDYTKGELVETIGHNLAKRLKTDSI